MRVTIGDWREVLQELPARIHAWLPRLAHEGIVGADAIFACLGPALEIFSRYSRVEKASGEVDDAQHLPGIRLGRGLQGGAGHGLRRAWTPPASRRTPA
ncbi:MAG: hypothetical protein V9H69_17605 [Anaerolineae bacterium]